MIAVGDSGTILRTTDAGSNWTLVSSATSAQLFGVAFADARTGVAVGAQGTILRTTEAGASWISQPSPTALQLNAVSFADESTPVQQ